MGTLTRILALMWPDKFAYYILWMMMIYLTDVWKLDFTHAAAIINIWRGSICVLPLAFVYVADAFLSNFWVLLFTSLSYTLGFGLLWMSSPPVLAKANGNCAEYKPECIGDNQEHLFYTALAFIAVGMAGHLASLPFFMAEQFGNIFTEFVGNFAKIAERMERSDTGSGGGGCCSVCCTMCCTMCGPFCGVFLSFLIAVAGILVVIFVKAWSILFGLCAIFALVSFLVYLSGILTYDRVRAEGSVFTIVFRVVVAAMSKLFCRRPQDVNELYENRDVAEDVLLLPHTNSLRCLDKAAIILPQPELEQQVQKRWKLCRVTEVESTKITIRTIPLYIMFILCGVVSAIGDTYFLEQAKNLDPRLGHIKVPLILFLWFYLVGSAILSKLFIKIAYGFVTSSQPLRRYVAPVGVAVAMMFSVVCCITAAKVESKRLGVVKVNGLIDKPDERVPMTVFWLVPQFLLLGGLDGIREFSVPYLLVDQTPVAMIKYFNFVISAIFGIGMMGSPLLVKIVGTISQNKSGSTWFQSTLSKSRLDNYYWVLAALSGANLVVYVVVASLYRYRDSIIQELEEQEEESVGNMFHSDF